MDNEQIADQILAAITELLQVAGPQWTLQALTALAEEAASAVAQQMATGPQQLPMEGGMPSPQPIPGARGMMGRRMPN